MQQINQQGFVLITAAVFLIVLTLVAVTAMKSTSLELRMSNNETIRMEAFDASEAPRVLTADLLDVHTFNRGWPKIAGGTVENNIFDYAMPAGLTVRDKNGNDTPDDLYLGNEESTFSPTGLLPDVHYANTISPTDQTDISVQSDIAVYKLRAALSPGAGSAMVAGYEGVGRASAAAGSSIYYRVFSRGVNPDASWDEATGTWSSATAQSCTACEYRSVVRN